MFFVGNDRRDPLIRLAGWILASVDQSEICRIIGLLAGNACSEDLLQLPGNGVGKVIDFAKNFSRETARPA